MWLTVPVGAIQQVQPFDRDGRLLQVRFRQAERSRLLQLLSAGAPQDVVLLNLGNSQPRWLQALWALTGQ